LVTSKEKTPTRESNLTEARTLGLGGPPYQWRMPNKMREGKEICRPVGPKKSEAKKGVYYETGTPNTFTLKEKDQCCPRGCMLQGGGKREAAGEVGYTSPSWIKGTLRLQRKTRLKGGHWDLKGGC